MGDDDLAVLEAREAALRCQLLGNSTADGDAALPTRVLAAKAQLEQLSGAISGFSKLSAFCRSHLVQVFQENVGLEVCLHVEEG